MKQYPYRMNTLILALTILPLLTTGEAHAAPHVKHAAKVRHARPATQGTRLVATGSVDPNTSSVKAVSADNRFTWVQVQPTTLVVQAGKRITVGDIGEGDKLLCQGEWVDDAWGPMFRAKRVEIIGRISDAGLQEKVAVACQSASQSDGAGSAGSGFGQTDTGARQLRQLTDLDPFVNAFQSRYDAMAEAQKDVLNQFAKAERLGYDPSFEEDFEKSRQNLNSALSSLDNITPVPPSMSKTNSLIQQGCSAYREWSNLMQQHYRMGAFGTDNGYMVREEVKQSDKAAQLFDQALEESKSGIDNASH